ncbi:MAG: hypothetical protein JXD23_10055 [Spirochaetales bacterium]|nr:hypothetical protein [Spirochaetales bacterium]
MKKIERTIPDSFKLLFFLLKMNMAVTTSAAKQMIYTKNVAMKNMEGIVPSPYVHPHGTRRGVPVMSFVRSSIPENTPAIAYNTESRIHLFLFTENNRKSEYAMTKWKNVKEAKGQNTSIERQKRAFSNVPAWRYPNSIKARSPLARHVSKKRIFSRSFGDWAYTYTPITMHSINASNERMANTFIFTIINNKRR